MYSFHLKVVYESNMDCMVYQMQCDTQILSNTERIHNNLSMNAGNFEHHHKRESSIKVLVFRGKKLIYSEEEQKIKHHEGAPKRSYRHQCKI